MNGLAIYCDQGGDMISEAQLSSDQLRRALAKSMLACFTIELCDTYCNIALVPQPDITRVHYILRPVSAWARLSRLKKQGLLFAQVS